MLIGVVAVILIALLGCLLAIYTGGRFIRQMYGLSNNRAGARYVLQLMLGQAKFYSATVRGGALQHSLRDEPFGKIGGPGWLSIHNDTAVLTERGHAFSRIITGRGVQLRAFERVRGIIDLRTLSRTTIESAYTKDGIEVKVTTTITFRVRPPYSNSQWPRFAETLRSIVYDIPAGISWESTISSGVSDYIASKMLDELWMPDRPEMIPLRDMEAALRSSIEAVLSRRGIELIDLAIGPLEVPEEVVEQREEYWQKYWAAEAQVIRATAESEALRLRAVARAEVQAELIKAIAQSLRTMLTTGSHIPSDRVITHILEILAQNAREGSV